MARLATTIGKIIGFGASVFGSTALGSTGAAAFVVATSKSEEEDGNVSIGVIHNVNIEFPTLEFVRIDNADRMFNTFCFDARKEDTPENGGGRITWYNDGTGFYEHLSVSIFGRVRPAKYVEQVTVQLSCISSYPNLESNPLMDAIELGFLRVKTWAPANTSPSALADYDYVANKVAIPSWVDDDLYNDGKQFTVPIGFMWGERFNYENPADYFDDFGENGGGHFSDQYAFEEVNRFYRVLHYGKKYIEEAPTDYSEEPTLSFAVTFTAEVY